MAGKTVIIDKDLRPSYYDAFRCLAGGCIHSCCEGWHVSFSKKDYLALKRMEGSEELNGRMQDGLRRIRKGDLSEMYYGEFALKDGICPLLREDGLCQLQMEKGEKALPDVCKGFPRSEVYMPTGYWERALTPGCEAVLELLWELPDGVDFLSDPLPKEKWRQYKLPEDAPLQFFYAEIRSVCIDFLQDRRFPLPERILRMGIALQELAGGEQDIPGWFARQAARFEEGAGEGLLDEASQGRTTPMFLSNNFRVMFGLQSIDREFPAVRQDVLQGLGLEINQQDQTGKISVEAYCEARDRYEAQFKDRAFFMENLMVSLFFYMHMPSLASPEDLWKSYVNFCNVYSFLRFMAVMSCRKGAAGDQKELFRMLVHASRALLHSSKRQEALRDDFFDNNSATLAHMAVLLGG